jgi:hypothetical protein
MFKDLVKLSGYLNSMGHNKESRYIDNIIKKASDEIPYPDPNFLYHGTAKSNVEEIKQNGLQPGFGNVVKGTEGYGYYMDEDYFPESERVDGVLFFSDNPDTWKYGSLRDGKLLGGDNMDDAALIIIENGDDIFRMVDPGTIINYDGDKVDYVPVEYGEDIPVDRLPPFIESGDFFSFDWQPVKHILVGEGLRLFLSKYEESKRVEESVNNLKNNIPEKLYHATYTPFERSISDNGLGGNQDTMWEDSVRGVVYLAKDSLVAESYAENSDIAWDRFNEDQDFGIITYEVDTANLDKDLFDIDHNVVGVDGGTLEYHGVIPSSALKVINRYYMW